MNNEALKISQSEITSDNVKDFEKEILKYVSELPEKARVFLDFAEVKYIASIGLRVLLMLLKNSNRNITVLNASEEVKEVLSVTGLNTLMSIHSPFKTITTKGCKKLGRGWYGTVYRLDDDKIVKIYHDNPVNTLEKIEDEREISKKIYLTGLPCAAVYDIVKTEDGRLGAVYEFIGGRTISELMKEYTDKIEEYADNMGKLLRRLHSCTFEHGEIPSFRKAIADFMKNAKRKISPEDEKIFIEFADEFSRVNNLLHGDFNTGNVMLSEGEYVLIDVGGAFLGHPLFEIGARYPFVLMNAEAVNKPKTLKLPEVRFYKKFLASYFEGVPPEKLALIEEKIKIVALFFLIFSYYVLGIFIPCIDKLKAHYMAVKDKLFPIAEWWEF